MGPRHRGYGLFLLFAAWLASGTMWAEAAPTGTSAPDREETYQSLTTLQGRDFDRAFLSMMLVHRQAAIKVSRAAVPRLRDKSVQSWAVALVRTEALERDRITQQLAQMGGADTKNADLAKVEFTQRFLTTNEATTPDRMFLQQMAIHQASAVAMGQLALKRTHDAHVLALARDALASDTQRMREISVRLHDHPV